MSSVSSESKRWRVALLGATGVVGQRLVRRLAAHPWFELVALGASSRSAGRRYGDATRWLLPTAQPATVASLGVEEVDAIVERGDLDLVLSALDAETARRVEPALVARGLAVVTNASAQRMAAGVPLVVPEVNADHLDLVARRPSGAGFVAANPNCAVIGLALALRPLVDAFGVERVQVATMQAASGAGHPGVASLDLLGNVVPGIAGEEEKLESEPAKIFGRLGPHGIEPASFAVSAQTHRVPVVDGHLLAVSVALGREVSTAEAGAALEAFRPPAEVRELPSAPARALELLDGEHGPQPRLDVERGAGMTVSVGRLRRCSVLGLRFVALVHNAERGAAGGTLLVAELAARRGLLDADDRGARVARMRAAS